MRALLTLAAAALAIVAAAWTSAPAAADRRGITETDLFKFVWVADPQISPDGSQVAFVRVTVDQKKEGYDTALWLVKTSGSEPPRVLTNGPRDTAPRWSPDGSRLAFVRSPEKEGRPQPAQIFVLTMGGGEARAITDLPKGAGGPEWSPDGRTIAFASTTRADDLAKAEAAKTAKPGEPPRESDVRV